MNIDKQKRLARIIAQLKVGVGESSDLAASLQELFPESKPFEAEALSLLFAQRLKRLATTHAESQIEELISGSRWRALVESYHHAVGSERLDIHMELDDREMAISVFSSFEWQGLVDKHYGKNSEVTTFFQNLETSNGKN